MAHGNSSACRSQDHTFVHPVLNFHRPTHSTGSRQCVPSHWVRVDHAPEAAFLSEEPRGHGSPDPILVSAVVDPVRVHGPTVAARYSPFTHYARFGREVS